MEKTFFLRVDIESNKGLEEGIPKLLNLLDKYDIKASFYVVMGGESGLYELLRYSGKLKTGNERNIKLWNLREKIRMAFFPRDFVKKNENILIRILNEGHELGIHGWKHRAWTRGLDKINVNEHIKKARQKYIKLFNKTPISFCSPAFNINERVLSCLESNNIRFISDFPGNFPDMHGKIKNVPITIEGKDKMPIIEYLVSEGKKDEEIFEIIKKEIKKEKLASFYIHDLFEARFKLNLLDKIFNFIKEEKIKTKRIIDY